MLTISEELSISIKIKDSGSDKPFKKEEHEEEKYKMQYIDAIFKKFQSEENWNSIRW